MIQGWLIELLHGIGRLFLNPLFYWSIVFVFLIGHYRIKSERHDFGFKLFNVFSEWKNTWQTSLISGIIVSMLMLGIGVVFTYETIILLSLVMILLSLSFQLTFLSPSYTIGLTYFLLIFLPKLLENQSMIDSNLFSSVNYSSLVILLGLFIFIEGVMVRKVKRNHTFPELSLSSRGAWIGAHRLKKIGIVPFFALMPTGIIKPFASYWPFLPIGNDETFSLILVPLIIGFDYKVKGELPQHAARRIAGNLFLLSIIVILLAVGSLYIPFLSFIAVFVAIIGKEWIHYRQRVTDQEKKPYFYHSDQGLKILGVIPGTPAERLHVYVGEMITKVNGIKVTTVDQFYHALQKGRAHFKLEIIDDAGEIRFIQSAFFENDPHELGFIFTTSPYRGNEKAKTS